MTVNEHVLVLPDWSVALHCTVVVPTGKVKPEAGLHITAAEPLLSTAVTLKLTLAPHSPGSAGWVIAAGQVITGGIVSTMVLAMEAVLLVEFGSGIGDETTVVFVTNPSLEVLLEPTMLMFAVAPAKMVPSEKLKPEEPEKVPWELVAETKERPAGKVS